MGPDERSYRADIADARFRMGVDAGRWRLARDTWPHPVIAVNAATRPDGPEHIAMRFDLIGYPVDAPTAAPWDLDNDTALPADLWPTGGRVGLAFNPGWNPAPGTFAMYIPMDRFAILGHDQWRVQHEATIWDPSRMTIVDYLKVIHDLLHSSEYSGTRRAA